MNQNRQWLKQMIGRYLAGKSTKKEQDFLDAYDNLFRSKSSEPNELSHEEQTRLEKKMEHNIMAVIARKEGKEWRKRKEWNDPDVRRTIPLWPRIAVAAAACTLMLVGGYYILHDHSRKALPAATISTPKILPGSNKAILTLANGAQISLTQQKDGQIAAQNGVNIIKTANGQIAYTGANSATSRPNNPNNPNDFTASAKNTVSTPGGGQYQIVLPDGTKVWLNAVSSLSFPVSFAGVENREVDLKGEAYFEVAKDKQHPFIVRTSAQQVKVLGTHFNINAYSDEPATITTLLEGAVNVAAHDGVTSATITPDQQTQIRQGKITVREVIAEDAIAWKEGYFRFDNDPLEEVLKKISRWYNVSIVYKDDNIKNKTAYGTMSRFSDISDVIKLLELTKTARFEILDNKIIVLDYSPLTN